MRPSVFVLLLLIAACAPATTAMTGTTAPVTRYTATGTVLEDERHGPQFCTAVMESLPPQCDGADIVGWDWGVVQHESSGGVKWGEYTVVGTWDGTRLTLTEPPKPPKPPVSLPGNDDPALTSPCPEPASGWKPVDPARATQKASDAAMRVAQASPQYAGAWLDQSYLDEGLSPADREAAANDSARYVLNFQFTGDLAGNERRVRKVWGGALCVSLAKHTEAELRAIQEKVRKEIPGVQSSAVDTRANRVEVTVFVATDELQRDLDARYGPGTVHAAGVLRPVTS
jgi:hypothetical protein